MSTGRVATVVLAVVMVLVALEREPLSGQADRGGTFVAIPAAFPDIDARALLVRERGRDIVLLRADDAMPDVLAMSLLVLERARANDPTPRHGQMIPITGFVLTDPPRGRDFRHEEAILRRLDSAPIRTVGNLGDGRWIRIRPPGD